MRRTLPEFPESEGINNPAVIKNSCILITFERNNCSTKMAIEKSTDPDFYTKIIEEKGLPFVEKPHATSS